jgi:hypothetical protein
MAEFFAYVRDGFEAASDLFTQASKSSLKRRLEADSAGEGAIKTRRIRSAYGKDQTAVGILALQSAERLVKRGNEQIASYVSASRRAATLAARPPRMLSQRSDDLPRMRAQLQWQGQRLQQTAASSATATYVAAWEGRAATTASNIAFGLRHTSNTNPRAWGWQEIDRLCKTAGEAAAHDIRDADPADMFAVPMATSSIAAWADCVPASEQPFDSDSWIACLEALVRTGGKIHYTWKLQTVSVALAIVYLCLEQSIKSAEEAGASSGAGPADEFAIAQLDSASVAHAKLAMPIIVRIITLITGRPAKHANTAESTHVQAMIGVITSEQFIEMCAKDKSTILGQPGKTILERQNNIAQLKHLMDQLRGALPTPPPITVESGLAQASDPTSTDGLTGLYEQQLLEAVADGNAAVAEGGGAAAPGAAAQDEDDDDDDL